MILRQWTWTSFWTLSLWMIGQTMALVSNNQKSIPSHYQILILPGFGNAAMDYTKPQSLVDSLIEQGWSQDQVAVLPVQRTDWLQVFWRGMLDLDFWLAQAAPTQPAFRWYLERIWNHVQDTTKGKDESETNDDEDTSSKPKTQVILVGHSAGGWLGRAAVGFGIRDELLHVQQIAGMVTLGAPHLPPPPGVMDMTRGALRITHETFPGAFHKPLFYITAIGKAVVGKQQQRTSPLEPTTLEGFAFNSYEAVCGDGTTIGDGVVPQCAGHLEDALQLDLDGVLHSINAPDNWYGSSEIIDRWHGPMLQTLHQNEKTI